jgi:hypothetical protein
LYQSGKCLGVPAKAHGWSLPGYALVARSIRDVGVGLMAAQDRIASAMAELLPLPAI